MAVTEENGRRWRTSDETASARQERRITCSECLKTLGRSVR